MTVEGVCQTADVVCMLYPYGGAYGLRTQGN